MMDFYGHPFSSYCQKVLVALYENDLPFEFRMLSADHPDNGARFADMWPMEKMPALVDGGRTVVESSVIIEYLDLKHPGPVRMLPQEEDKALEVRMLDRFFDHYVMTPMQRIVFDFIRPAEQRDPYGVAEAKALLDKSYRWLEGRIGSGWAAGDAFTLADCAAAPSLFYADWVHPVPLECEGVRAYRQRLLERPSFARAVDGGRPYRSIFPPGAPDRD
jgi:glutathione S-transferase